MAKRRAKGEGSICQRSAHQWDGSIQTAGTRHRVYGRTRSQVVDKLETLRRQARLAGGAIPDAGDRTVGDLLDEWLRASSPNCGPRTLMGNTRVARRHLAPLSDVNLARLQTVAIQRVATLLTAVSGGQQIELRHWARAQPIVEDWRRGVYNLWEHSHTPASQDDRASLLEERIVHRHEQAGKPLTIREATRGWYRAGALRREDVTAAYQALVATGDLVEVPGQRTTRYAPPGQGGHE